MDIFNADLHLHSPKSIAVSKNLNLDTVLDTCKKKGLHLLGTGDILQPDWLKYMEKKQNTRERWYKKMIFVTVGTHYLGFERLIKKIDEIAIRTDEEIVAQIGFTSYKPKNVKYYAFIKEDEIFDYYKKSRIVVTHSGAGTLLNLLPYKKAIVVVPRLKKYNECIDDHQLELTKVIKNKGLATVVYNIEDLELALNNLNIGTIEFDKNNGDLINYIKKYIEDFKTWTSAW